MISSPELQFFSPEGYPPQANPKELTTGFACALVLAPKVPAATALSQLSKNTGLEDLARHALSLHVLRCVSRRPERCHWMWKYRSGTLATFSSCLSSVWIEFTRPFTKAFLGGKDPVVISCREAARGCCANSQGCRPHTALPLRAQEDALGHNPEPQRGLEVIQHSQRVRARVHVCVHMCVRSCLWFEAIATLPRCLNTTHPFLSSYLLEAPPRPLPASTQHQGNSTFLSQPELTRPTAPHACICTLRLAFFLV